jgi:ubiquitin C-terminal hydrolase
MYDEYGPISATPLFRTLHREAGRFADGEQHDAQEFLAFLADAIHEDLNR